jgi:calcium-dependent protein kinase
MFENSTGEPKLIDFGLSKVGESLMHSRVGSLSTMSPDVIQGSYTAKADIWSVGVLAFILLSGKLPFDGDTFKQIAAKIVHGNYSMKGPEWSSVSKPAKDFVRSLLTYEPSYRPTAAQALANPWLQRTYSLQDRQASPALMHDVNRALVQSSHDSRFKKIVTMMIAYNYSNENLKELRNAFDTIDTNNHGTITYAEFRAALEKDCNFSNDDDLKALFQNIDVNGSGVINYTEFLAAVMQCRGQIEEEQIAAAFDKIDADHCGYITRQDLCDILCKHCTAENCNVMVQDVLNEVDDDGDGML